MKNNKKRTGVLAGLLAGALLVTGTLAWQDVNQHKTNKFTTTSVEHNVTLVETFEEVTNWRKGEAKVNQIAVRNGQDTDDITSYIYEDAYVRVQLKEFMEIKNKSYTYSEKRYMVDEKGNFKRFATLELAQEFMATLGEEAPLDGRIEEVTGLFDKDDEGNAKGFFYIATQQADKNGQYGKFIVMGEVLGEGDVLVEGSINQDHSSEDQHNNAIVDEETGSIDYNVDEDQYTTHLWGAGDNMSAEGNPFTQYVKWTFGLDVITMAEWDGQPTAQWIVDTDSTEGYAYWGEKLVHGTDATATPKSLTNNILEKVTLIEQPYGAAEYYIHVNMDAVNLKDVSLWADAPEKISKAHNGKDEISLARKALMNVIQEAIDLQGEHIATPIAQQLREQIAQAQSAYEVPKTTVEALAQEQTALLTAIENFKNDALTQAKIRLLQQFDNAKAIDTNNKIVVTRKNLETTLVNTEALLDNMDANIEAVNAMSESLTVAVEGLLDARGPEIKNGKVTNFARHNWTVLKFDENTNRTLIYSDVLSQEDFSAMGIMANAKSIKYSDTRAAKKYLDSNLYKADQAFYATFIANDASAADYVHPVSFAEEAINSLSTRVDGPTLIDDNGVKMAFSLSVSDLNYYKIMASDLIQTGSGVDYVWTRTPRSNTEITEIALSTGAQANPGYIDSQYGVRVAVWVDAIQN